MEYAGIAIIPLLIGVLEMFKKLGLKERYIPVFSVILGIAIGVALLSAGDVKSGIVQGVYVGLSAVGLYSGTKNTIEHK